MYCYFIQPYLNKFANSLVGYELLIRKREDNAWKLPPSFASVPNEVQGQLLVEVAAKLARKIEFVAVNMNWTQFMDHDFAQVLADTQKKIFPVALIIEVTEEPVDKQISFAQVVEQIMFYHHNGIQLTLDDVGTGINTYEKIKVLLPFANAIKFAMQNFRHSGNEDQIPASLTFWKKIAQENHLRLIVEGIENAADDQLLDRLKITYRQGYYYSKPHRLE